MGADSKIQWTHHTFNPWWGCARVSPGCEHCYAEAFAKRTGKATWGVKEPRRFFGDKHWAEPLKWNKAAEKAGERHRVFVASMADVFEDRRDLDEQRARLWDLINGCADLDWLLLTKRPENIARLLPADWHDRGPWPNVWLGTTAEDQKRAEERIPELLKVPAVVRFLSCEPLLEAVALDLPRCETHDREFVSDDGAWCNECSADGYSGELSYGHWLDGAASEDQPGINWVIVGGESGPGARQFVDQWARDLVSECRGASVAVFVKQFGAKPAEYVAPSGAPDDGGDLIPLRLASRKGDDMAEWPEDLRVRQFPEIEA
jgi:protein gp37